MLTGETRLTEPAYQVMEGATVEAGRGGAIALAERPDFTDLLKRIEVPVLFMVGVEDSLYAVQVSRAIADSIPNSSLAILPGGSHAAVFEAAGNAAAAIQTWRETLPLRQPSSLLEDQPTTARLYLSTEGSAAGTIQPRLSRGERNVWVFDSSPAQNHGRVGTRRRLLAAGHRGRGPRSLPRSSPRLSTPSVGTGQPPRCPDRRPARSRTGRGLYPTFSAEIF